MFDIGFWEMALIFIIGLVVLGPERLPIAIRSVMKWINTLQRGWQILLKMKFLKS